MVDLSTMITRKIRKEEEVVVKFNYECDWDFSKQRDSSFFWDDLSSNGASSVASEKNAFVTDGAERVLGKTRAGGVLG